VNAVAKALGPSNEDARARLLAAALRLFAQQGFAKTSTRELAEEAQVNVASISYYFGDKAGLYRAVFTEPLAATCEDVNRYEGAELPLADALRGFYAGFLEPLKQGDTARWCMKLHFREMLEPTGLCDVNEALGVGPMHGALVALLGRHLGLEAPDDELDRLAVCLTGLGVHLHVGRDMTDQVAPRLHQGDESLARWSDALVRYASALVRAEAERRGLCWREPASGAATP
jgi:TetR/AcrR family transcriptional regulator, regulator of cefoperazone and chloramphenicol sensitivity